MNIEIDDHIKVLIEEMCEKMNQTPSQLVALLLTSVSMLYIPGIFLHSPYIE
jgi:antitoxin component of RelBE/YafQ-DinJ toxin-antitoxin module